jgi:hypothetical protein
MLRNRIRRGWLWELQMALPLLPSFAAWLDCPVVLRVTFWAHTRVVPTMFCRLGAALCWHAACLERPPFCACLLENMQ